MYVFTDDWISEIRERYDAAPVYRRPNNYHFATSSRFSPQRRQLENWVSSLRPVAQQTLIPRLRDPNLFKEAYNELAVGNLLREDLGFNCQYEAPHFVDGMKYNPDWTIPASDKLPSFVTEVFTDNPSQTFSREDYKWMHLLNRLQEIRIGVAVSITDHLFLSEAPEEQQSKKIVTEVKRWLTEQSPPAGEAIRIDNISFEIIRWNPKFEKVATGGPAQSLESASAPLRKKILKKVRKFAPLSNNGIPFVVAIVANFHTGRDFTELSDVLFGKSGLFRKRTDLSAVLWVWNFTGTEWHFKAVHNPIAKNPLPANTFDMH